MTAFLWLAFTSSFWFLKFLFLAGWFVARWIAWLVWPGIFIAAIGATLGLGCRQASAGWFGWLGTDTTKLEAANRAVHAAAEVVNESARLQADQNVAISEAITALSSERAQLAGHLQHIGELAGRDSQWAAALTAFSPVLIAVAVLAVGALALWLAYREHAGDAELAEVLVESVTSEHGRLNLGFFNSTSNTSGPQMLLPGDAQQVSFTTPTNNDEGGLPF
jgi:ABC-type multidrug transport system fused ATPase/permease subunit